MPNLKTHISLSGLLTVNAIVAYSYSYLDFYAYTHLFQASSPLLPLLPPSIARDAFASGNKKRVQGKERVKERGFISAGHPALAVDHLHLARWPWWPWWLIDCDIFSAGHPALAVEPLSVIMIMIFIIIITMNMIIFSWPPCTGSRASPCCDMTMMTVMRTIMTMITLMTMFITTFSQLATLLWQ